LIILALIAACIAGMWAVEKFQSASATHDLRMIVIDEWIGIWLALLLCAPRWDQLVLAFALFRLFDIWKPWPIRFLDKNVKGAAGVIVDDVLAGVLAGLCVFGYGQWMMSF
jgi:phosphatidylglycerophosphatase A